MRMGGGGGRQGGSRLDDIDDGDLKSSRQRYDAFRKRWRGKNKPDEGKSKPGQPTKTSHLHRYVSWLRPFLGQILAVLGLGIVVALFDTIWPIFIGDMIDAMGGDTSSLRIPLVRGWSPQQVLLGLGLSAVAVILIGRFIGLIRNVVMIRLSMQTAHQLRAQLFRKFVRLSVTELHDLKSGGVISRLSNDVDQTTELVGRGVISPATALVRLIVVVVVMCFYNWTLTVMSMGLLLVLALLHNVAMRQIRPIFRSMGKDRAGIDGRVGETFGGIRVVRSFAREFNEELTYGVGHHTVIRKQVWARLLMYSFMMLWELLMPLVGLLIIWVGGYYVLGGSLSVGEIMVLQMLSLQVLGPVMQIVNSMTETQKGLAAMDRVYEILDKGDEKPDRPGAVDAPEYVESIHFNNVSFSYAGAEEPSAEHTDGETEVEEKTQDEAQDDNEDALQRVSLHMSGGQTVALVGHSGAGKSTFVDLVARFHDPTEGAILLNGTDLRDYRLQSLRGLLGIVQQETFLFDGSIADNIRYGNRDASDAAVREAAVAANAAEFIDQLDRGFDSIIGERGVKLSGGQRQRLAIARAILANPRILILDESTSNLDSESEQLIQASMDALRQGRTTFVIAHRLSTIRNADHIIVLDHGRVIEQGNHDSLMPANSTYAAMVERQRLAATTDQG